MVGGLLLRTSDADLPLRSQQEARPFLCLLIRRCQPLLARTHQGTDRRRLPRFRFLIITAHRTSAPPPHGSASPTRIPKSPATTSSPASSLTSAGCLTTTSRRSSMRKRGYVLFRRPPLLAHYFLQFASLRTTLEANMHYADLFPPGDTIWLTRPDDLELPADVPGMVRTAPRLFRVS